MKKIKEGFFEGVTIEDNIDSNTKDELQKLMDELSERTFKAAERSIIVATPALTKLIDEQ